MSSQTWSQALICKALSISNMKDRRDQTINPEHERNCQTEKRFKNTSYRIGKMMHTFISEKGARHENADCISGRWAQSTLL